jgi:cysteine desulfurase/selenocysteine lyase
MSNTAVGVPVELRGVRAALDVERIRADFPILRRQVRGRALTYLDNAATTQKPQQVLDALIGYYTSCNANVHRGVHFLSEIATEAHDVARGKVRAFLNAASTREIVFTRNSTEGINGAPLEYRPLAAALRGTWSAPSGCADR